MARILFQIGGFGARRPWAVVVAWLVVIAAVGVAAWGLRRPLSGTFAIPGTEFQAVLDDLRDNFPQAAGGTGSVMLRSTGGAFTAAQREAIAAVIAEWQRAPGVRAVIDPFATQEMLEGKGVARPKTPWEMVFLMRQGALVRGLRFVSQDGAAAIVQISFHDEVQNVPLAQREHLQHVGRGLERHGIEVDYSKDITQNVSDIIGLGELVGVVVAGIVLLVMLGSLVAAGLPLGMALVGVGVGLGLTMAAGHWVDMQSITPALALMLGSAVGIDYSLFIVNRHRNQLLHGMNKTASLARATATAGNAVVFAGLTVIIALAALAVTGIPFMAVMGLAAAGTVATAVLAAVTLTPAALSLIGHRVMPGRSWRRHGFTARGEEIPGAAHPAEDDDAAAPAAAAGTPAQPLSDSRWGALTTRHPWLTLLVTLVVIGVLAVPARHMRLGLPDGSAEPRHSTAYRAYVRTAETFGAGMNGPLVAVGTLPANTGPQASALAQLKAGEALKAAPGARAVVPIGASPDGKAVAWQVIPAGGPSEQSTVDLVRHLRDRRAAMRADSGVDIRLTGQTVANIDISRLLGGALPAYVALVVGLSLLLLLLVFRSLLVPLIATGGFLLTLAGTFGAVVAVYQWGWLAPLFAVSTPGPLLSFLPTILVGVLFGLAMDYQMFLVSGMREAHMHGQDARHAVLTGFRHGRRVVRAAALIMAAVFAGFIHARLTMIRPIGFGLAAGMLIDAFLVRLTLTPALMHLLGERAWWLPGWLARILPDVDLEGAGLGHDEQARAALLGLGRR